MEMNAFEIIVLLFLFAIFATMLVNVWMTRTTLAAAKFTLRRRVVLPMSTGVAVLPSQSAQITARPQHSWFRPERLYISGAGTEGGAADWVINDIKVGGKSQFIQSGDVPGDMFSTNAIDSFVSWDRADKNGDVVVVATYIGTNEKGVPFYASFTGEGANDEEAHVPERRVA